MPKHLFFHAFEACSVAASAVIHVAAHAVPSASKRCCFPTMNTKRLAQRTFHCVNNLMRPWSQYRPCSGLNCMEGILLRAVVPSIKPCGPATRDM
eukprot:361381-Chlamydomonas_euryale.AAC.3